MSSNKAKFPNWDGLSPNTQRTSLRDDIAPNYEDWDQIVAEFLKIQNEGMAVGTGATGNPDTTSIWSLTYGTNITLGSDGNRISAHGDGITVGDNSVDISAQGRLLTVADDSSRVHILGFAVSAGAEVSADAETDAGHDILGGGFVVTLGASDIFGWGHFLSIFGHYSAAVGFGINITGQASLAIGQNLTVWHKAAVALGEGHEIGFGYARRRDSTNGGGFAVGKRHLLRKAHCNAFGHRGLSNWDFHSLWTTNRNEDTDPNLQTGLAGSAQVSLRPSWTYTDGAETKILAQFPIREGDSYAMKLLAQAKASDVTKQAECHYFEVANFLIRRDFSTLELKNITDPNGPAEWTLNGQLQSHVEMVLRIGPELDANVFAIGEEVQSDGSEQGGAGNEATGAIITDISADGTVLMLKNSVSGSVSHTGVTGTAVAGEIFRSTTTNSRFIADSGALSGGAGVMKVNRITFIAGRFTPAPTNGETFVGERSGASITLDADFTASPIYLQKETITGQNSNAQAVIERNQVNASVNPVQVDGKIVVTNFANGALDTITLRVAGTDYTLTEGTDFSAVTDDPTTAANIKTAIDALSLAGITVTVNSATVIITGGATNVVTSDETAWTASLLVYYRSLLGTLTIDGQEVHNGIGGPNGAKATIVATTLNISPVHIKGKALAEDADISLVLENSMGAEVPSAIVTLPSGSDNPYRAYVKATGVAGTRYQWGCRPISVDIAA